MRDRSVKLGGAALFVGNLGYFLFLTERKYPDIAVEGFYLSIAFVGFIVSSLMWLRKDAWRANGIQGDWILALFIPLSLPIMFPAVFADPRWMVAAMFLPLLFVLSGDTFRRYGRTGTTMMQLVFATHGILHLRQWSHSLGMVGLILFLSLMGILLTEARRRHFAGRSVSAPMPLDLGAEDGLLVTGSHVSSENEPAESGVVVEGPFEQVRIRNQP
jgi:hypothetical protein